MMNTTAFERFLSHTPENRAQAIEDMQTQAALGLCTVATLLENQKAPLPPATLEGVAQVIREIATMGAVAVL